MTNSDDPRAWRSALGVAALLALAACVGCSDPSTPVAATADARVQLDDAQKSNSCDGKGTPFVLPVTEHTPGGEFSATLSAANPAKFSMGDNDWTLRIDGTDGSPAAGVSFDVVPWMPEHRHGSVKTVIVTDSGGGNYEANPINVNMAGIWEIRIEFPSDGGTPLRAVFSFCASSR